MWLLKRITLYHKRLERSKINILTYPHTHSYSQTHVLTRHIGEIVELQLSECGNISNEGIISWTCFYGCLS